ncbi:hypothetical protein F2P44_20150 [Massilia sp. CCM 8695]|uniref:Uncharacterized protein n=1 Tax=Massilia frigida TaxID=2609281 RepID=A0ABX0N852_9BURK|nr:hypothetical protein [Massilia frigida]NHZ81570.1 hypothetical protein [Massilia frigida]
MKHSKKTLALLAQCPTFRNWILQNLTRKQLDEICHAPRASRLFSSAHPLNDEKLAATVFRAYRQDAIGCIKYQFESLEHFGEMRGHGPTWNAFYHHALITAIALMVVECPEVLTLALMPIRTGV